MAGPGSYTQNFTGSGTDDAPSIDAISAGKNLNNIHWTASSADRTTFTIHRLVQDVARSKLDKAMAMQTLNDALDWLNNAFKGEPC
jgi:hypothetical protein